MIVVTGASRGIGRAVAERLIDQGHEVLGVARSSVQANFEILPLDVSEEAQVKDLARSIRSRSSDVTAVINAAGIASMNLALMAPAKSVRTVIDTNLLGTIFVCQKLAPFLIRAGGGSIVNFSTIAVNLALQGESAYVASKSGVEGFSRTLARELGGHGINVNCIAPGPISTDLLKGVSNDQIRRIIDHQILQRQFSLDDVCDVVEVLLDARSQSLTGHVMHIGGA